MKLTAMTGVLCLTVAAVAQGVHYDYDRLANFSAYHTYQWMDMKSTKAPDQLTDQNIKRAVDEQLARKGLLRVDRGGNLQATYHVEVDHEKHYTAFGARPRWTGLGQVNTSTIDVGQLTVELFDPARSQLVWRGDAEKTLDIKKDPDKNYRNLEKAMAKLFKNYPPGHDQR
jgi:hypothetical protein